MRLAKKINDTIVINEFSTLPELNVLCGVENLPIEYLNENGYYLVDDVSYDEIMQYLGDWYLDGDVAKQKVVDKAFGTLQEEKDKRIEYIKNKYFKLLSATDWYIVRYAERQIQIPFEISQSRQMLRIECDNKINEINALNSIKDIIQYE